MNPKQQFINRASTNATYRPIPAPVPPPMPVQSTAERIRQGVAGVETGTLVSDILTGRPVPSRDVVRGRGGYLPSSEPERYKFIQAATARKKESNMAIGKYQVTSNELAAYAPRYLGRPVTPEEFSASPSLQDQYMDNKIKYLTEQGHTPEQIADIHSKGIKRSSPPGSKVYQDPEYVEKFKRNFYRPLSEISQGLKNLGN